jgi:hypothetical protein
LPGKQTKQLKAWFLITPGDFVCLFGKTPNKPNKNFVKRLQISCLAKHAKQSQTA